MEVAAGRPSSIGVDRASHAPSPRRRPATTFLCMRHRPPLPFAIERPKPKQAAAPDVRTPTRQATRERRSPRRAGGDHTPHVRTARSLQRACRRRRPHGRPRNKCETTMVRVGSSIGFCLVFLGS